MPLLNFPRLPVIALFISAMVWGTFGSGEMVIEEVVQKGNLMRADELQQDCGKTYEICYPEAGFVCCENSICERFRPAIPGICQDCKKVGQLCSFGADNVCCTGLTCIPQGFCIDIYSRIVDTAKIL